MREGRNPRNRKVPKTRGPYWRKRKAGPPRAYGDFRFLGAGQEPLVAPGEKFATTDPVTASQLYATRLAVLSDGSTPRPIAAKRQGSISATVTEFFAHRRKHIAVTEAWIANQEIMLGRAVRFFGADREMRNIRPDDVLEWVAALREEETCRGTHFRGESLRKHIHTLAELFSRAQRTGAVPPGYNPVSLLEKNERPQADPSPNVWLEVDDAARLLEAARTYPVTPVRKDPTRLRDPATMLAYPHLATFLLTGGRADEVLGLDVADLLFDRKLIAFRPNQWRRGKKGKTAGAERMVPMWPQLEAILRDYLQGRHLELRLQFDTTLLFPSAETGRRLNDIRKMIDRVAKRAGLQEGIYRATAFRKTFATAALQILDHGAPIAQRTVQAWLGHASGAMLEAVYGKLGTVRHRREVVEYRANVSGASTAGPVRRSEGVAV
ncbi:MAG: tyrosine-type recombinase/integrase [Gemmatimonadales bacterium]